MTYSWDRLMIDPLPGPRSAQDFTGLGQPVANVWEVSSHTSPIPPAGSSLPRLAGHLPGHLLLLDPAAGAVGMAEQITAAATEYGADSLTVIDVGGDALTTGQRPWTAQPPCGSTRHRRMSSQRTARPTRRRRARSRR
jgi:hypothetical protein